MVLLLEIAYVRLAKGKKISLITVLTEYYSQQEIITEQELEIRKLNDLLTIQDRRR